MASSGEHHEGVPPAEPTITFSQLIISNSESELSPKGRDEHPGIFHVSSGIHVDTMKDEYALEDIVHSTNEGVDVSDQIRSLERTPPSQNLSRQALLPRIDDDFLENVVYNEEGEDKDRDDTEETNDKFANSDYRRQEVRSDANNLSDLTKHLARLPTGNKYDGSPQRLGLGASNTTKTGTDMYYANAAKMFPTREYSDNGNRSEDDNSEDIELGSYEMTQNLEMDDERPQRNKHIGKFELKRKIHEMGSRTKADIDFFREFVEPHRKGLTRSFWNLAVYIMLPSLVMAIILFYGFENHPVGVALAPCQNSSEALTEAMVKVPSKNVKITAAPTMRPTNAPTYPPTGIPSVSRAPSQAPTTRTGTNFPTIFPTRKPTYTFADKKNETLCRSEDISLRKASVSWWFLFIGVRQVITFCLSIVIQLIFVDFLTFRTRFFQKLIGTNIALAIGQSKGWPCILFFWALMDLIFLFGSRPFSRNWLFYQDFIDLFNSANPSGNITDNKYYKRIIYFALVLSGSATIKRTVMANFVGKRVVAHYRHDLTKIIKKLLTIGEIAELSHLTEQHQINDIRRKSTFQRMTSVGRMVVDKLEKSSIRSIDGQPGVKPTAFSPKFSQGEVDSEKLMSSTTDSRAFLTSIFDNLDEWEEPEVKDECQAVSIQDVLHFRRAVDFIHSDFPFSPVFGKATTREECARGSQKTFNNLLKRGQNVLDFEMLCKIAQNEDGTKNKKKVVELIRLFRPNRNGNITKMDFIKSIDTVYKQLRLILANISSSSQIDHAYGQISNVGFVVFISIIGLTMLGVDVNGLFLGITGVFVSFAFMISSASSKYLEGILLILVRKPYEIGDKVCFLEPNAPVDDFGPPSGGWIVEKVDLYTTTVRLGTTREYATFANGSLANSRILNLKRSDKPNVYMYLKFTMDITQEQLDEFRRRITEFIKDRPREWIKVVSLRCTDVETEQQYMKFALIVQHRESWQSFATIQISKGYVYVHALHLMKELHIDYTAPKLPIHITADQSMAVARSLRGVDGNDGDSGSSDPSEKKVRYARGDDSLPREKTEVSERPVPQFNATALGGIDGSIVRRKGGRNIRPLKPKISFEDAVIVLDDAKHKSV